MMKFLLNIVALIGLFKCCRADFCQYNFSISDLDSSVIKEVISFIGNGMFKCPTTEFMDSEVTFWSHTRDSPEDTLLDSNDPNLSKKKTIILIHGWLCNHKNDLLPDLKDAYLKRYDANVIIVDWSYYAAQTYGKAVCSGPNVGHAVANFLMVLENKLNIPIDSMHVIGHSMGGQIAGLTGQSLQIKHSRILGRITGLDPAGPLYVGKSPDERLDKTDAYFVDVIHTNGGLLGYSSRCGTVDYYPGCGKSQAGCPFSVMNLLSLDFVVKKFGCDHLRSVDYMIESVNSKKFRAKYNPLFCMSSESHISYMGEDSIDQYTDDSYILETNPQKPYAQG